LFPVFFLVALVAIIYTIQADHVGSIEFPWGQVFMIRDFPILGAIIAIVAGSFFLLRTLFAVQWAASRIPLPKFKVTFRNALTKIKYRVNEKVELAIAVENSGEDVAEDLEIWVCFPPEFNVRQGKGYHVELHDFPDADYPNYKAVIFTCERIHTNVRVDLVINVEMPKIADSYEIPVGISERKIGESEHELTVETHK
jgi:hypothetical protein